MGPEPSATPFAIDRLIESYAIRIFCWDFKSH